MTAKDIQIQVLKTVIKPLFKSQGFKVDRQTFYKPMTDFFIVANLQNFSWNNKDQVEFCFNIGIALTATLRDPLREKAAYHDLIAHFRESSFLLESQLNDKHRTKNGYSVSSETDLSEFSTYIERDFSEHVLPELSKWETLEDCMYFFDQNEFWGNHLRKAAAAHIRA